MKKLFLLIFGMMSFCSHAMESSGSEGPLFFCGHLIDFEKMPLCPKDQCPICCSPNKEAVAACNKVHHENAVKRMEHLIATGHSVKRFNEFKILLSERKKDTLLQDFLGLGEEYNWNWENFYNFMIFMDQVGPEKIHELRLTKEQKEKLVQSLKRETLPGVLMFRSTNPESFGLKKGNKIAVAFLDDGSMYACAYPSCCDRKDFKNHDDSDFEQYVGYFDWKKAKKITPQDIANVKTARTTALLIAARNRLLSVLCDDEESNLSE